MAVDGLIIPRTYNDYFSRSDPAAIRQLVAQYTDTALSTTSELPVQNKVVKAGLDSIGKPASLVYERARWLRFSATNKKGVVIAAGTTIIVGAHVFTAATNTAFDLSEDITTAGKDYFIYLNWEDGDVWTLTATTTKNADTATSRYIGRCHTLCVAAGGALTAKIPASPSSGIAAGDNVLVKSYEADVDPDFYNFYNKAAQSVSAGSYYDVITVAHPLAGFAAGDILPESIFCLSWKPKTLYEDGMVYDRDTDSCIDIYLQSGTGLKTKSEYNKTHTVSRQQWNHQEDMRQVGKKLLSDYEFTSAAIGSNETTNIYGSADVTTVGGHSDTANRRMISAIGCEEMAGYLWQWLDEVIGKSDENSWTTTDGRGAFGQEYWQPRALLAGGTWNNTSSCGSRCRHASNGRSAVAASIGGRGSSRVIRGL